MSKGITFLTCLEVLAKAEPDPDPDPDPSLLDLPLRLRVPSGETEAGDPADMIVTSVYVRELIIASLLTSQLLEVSLWRGI